MNFIAKWLLSLTPRYWLRNYKTNKELSKALFKRIENGDRFEYVCEHTAKLGDIVVRTANHPYASFTVKGVPGMPSRLDTIYLEKILTRHLMEGGNKKPLAQLRTKG